MLDEIKLNDPDYPEYDGKFTITFYEFSNEIGGFVYFVGHIRYETPLYETFTECYFDAASEIFRLMEAYRKEDQEFKKQVL